MTEKNELFPNESPWTHPWNCMDCCYYFFMHRKRAVIVLTIHSTLQRRKKTYRCWSLRRRRRQRWRWRPLFGGAYEGEREWRRENGRLRFIDFFHLVNSQELIWRGVVVAHARTRSLSRLARYGWLLAIIFLCFCIAFFLALVFSLLSSHGPRPVDPRIAAVPGQNVRADSRRCPCARSFRFRRKFRDGSFGAQSKMLVIHNWLPFGCEIRRNQFFHYGGNPNPNHLTRYGATLPRAAPPPPVQDGRASFATRTHSNTGDGPVWTTDNAYPSPTIKSKRHHYGHSKRVRRYKCVS